MIHVSNEIDEPKKYIIAQIELPIEIISEGDYRILNDHAQLQFFKCNALPPSKNYDNVFLGDIFHRFFSDEAEPDFVFKQAEPVTEPVPEPVPEPLTEPVPEPLTEPVPEPLTEPLTEPVPEPLTEPLPEPLTEPLTEPLPEPVPEPLTEPSYRIQMTSEEIENFLVQYPPSQKRSRSKNTSFRQYKTKRNHRITSKKLDDI